MAIDRVTRTLFWASSGLALTVGAFASPVQAQDAAVAEAPAADAQEGGPGDIVVTAQRRAERLLDVPVSVSVTRGESLERGNIRSLADLANRQSNFQILQTPGGDQLAVRGTASGTNSGFEQSVGTFIDGLYRQRARSTRVALFDIDRVEVLRGPQTTFFGANAIAGALNITTRKATSTLQGNASALYAFEDGEYNIEAGIGGPIAEGFNARVAGRLYGMNGYLDQEKLGGKGPHNRDGQVRASVNLQPTESLTIDARFDYARLRDTKTSGFGELIGCPPAVGNPGIGCAASIARFGAANLDTRLDYHTDAGVSFSYVDLYEGEVTTTLDLGGANLISTTGYLKQKFENQNNDLFPGPNALGTFALYGSLKEPFDQFSQELRLQSDTSGPIQYLGGLYYEKWELTPAFVNITTNRALGALPALAAVGYNASSGLGFRRIIDQHSRTLSGFVSLKANLTEQLSVTGSLRYTDNDKRADNLNIIFGETLAGTTALIPGTAAQQAAIATQFAAQAPALRIYPFNKRDDHALMPSANVQYKFTPDTMAYVSYARGFKAGGFSGSSNGTFNPEYVDAFEAGLKAQLFDRRVQTSISVFRSDYSDLQVSQIVPQPNGAQSITVITNAAKSRAQGVEFNLTATPTTRLRFSADLAYLDSKYRDFGSTSCYAVQTAAEGCVTSVVNGVATRSQSLSGRSPPLAPRWSGNVDASYAAPLGGDLGLTFGGTLYFKSAYFVAASLVPISRQKAYAKLDLRLMLNGEGSDRWEVGVIGKNVFSKRTIVTADDLPGNGGSYGVLLDRPRAIAVQASYRF